jgi:hypothetical protein
MLPTTPTDVLAAFAEFVARIDALEPDAPTHGALTIGLGGQESRVVLREPVARALVEALRAYHDPRDQGRCDHCGSPRLDANFGCRDCGRLSGVFGQLVAERAARHTEPAALGGPDALPTGQAAPATLGFPGRHDSHGRHAG